MKTPRGFTLVEVLLAVAIGSVVAIAAYQALSGVLATQASLHRHSTAWRNLEVRLAQLEEDLRLSLTPGGFTAESSRLRFTRANVQGMALGALEWQCGLGGLTRRPATNGESADAAEVAQSCEFAVWDAQKNTWVDSHRAEAPPYGVRVRLLSLDGKRLERLYALR